MTEISETFCSEATCHFIMSPHHRHHKTTPPFTVNWRPSC